MAGDGCVVAADEEEGFSCTEGLPSGLAGDLVSLFVSGLASLFVSGLASGLAGNAFFSGWGWAASSFDFFVSASGGRRRDG